MRIIVHYNLDYLLMINGIPFKKLGLAIFGGEGVATFRGSLLSRFTSGHKKLTLIAGGLLLSGGRYYRNFKVSQQVVQYTIDTKWDLGQNPAERTQSDP